MRVDQFFGELRSFATALESDCAALRKAVKEPQGSHAHGSETAVEALRIMHDDAADVMDAMEALECSPLHRIPMTSLVAAAAALLDRAEQQADDIESELEQYGFVKQPQEAEMDTAQGGAEEGANDAENEADEADEDGCSGNGTSECVYV
jgi:hypothetical protein